MIDWRLAKWGRAGSRGGSKVMSRRYEYKFVRVDKGAREREYQRIVDDHAREGWRLVQILAPGAGGLWASPNFIEVVLERDLEEQ